MPDATIEISVPDTSLADIYSAEALGHMWVTTYRIAQGSAEVQHGVVRLLYEDILPAEVREDDKKLEQSFRVARPLVKRIINSVGHAKYKGLYHYLSDASIAVNFESDVINPIRGKHKKPTMEQMLEKILCRDARYLPELGNKTSRTHGASHGQYFSHAIKYILLQSKASHPGIDDLFARMRPSFSSVAHKVMGASVSPPHVSDNLQGEMKHFTLNDLVASHIASNPADAERIGDALLELNINIGPAVTDTNSSNN
jgi:hypothetical protein